MLRYIENDKGAVLVTGLMFLAVISLLSGAVYMTTRGDVRMSARYSDSKAAFYQADAGVQYVLAHLRSNPITYPTSGNQTTVSVSVPTGFTFNSSVVIENVSSNLYRFQMTGTGPGNAQSSITVTFRVNEPPNPAFGLGIITDGNLNINGAPYINGSMHANGNINQNGAGIIHGTVTAAGTVSVGSTTPSGPPQGGVDPVAVPFITEAIFNSLRSRAQTSPNTYIDNSGSSSKGKPGSGGYDFSTSGDLGGAIIFVDGDVIISGNIENGSIIATGNITVNGSSQLTAGQIGVAMAAGGNITMNGASDSYGLFWSNGSFVQNGASTVNGSIVSTGNITRNGAFNFEFSGIGDFDFLPTGPPQPVVTSWRI